ncbi:hypothetical protein PCASD_24336 [Puccinia coronata f. sp. avenae]|uniref:Uncharacterized protein n=1 Tax=Puccinia coronata f. sp. avenae TaxID=200324 RepID=A0A2N5TMP0_9BASI|nr:hypothetical protein PCASD_24336 [Puccinia coronata f. sp. avenae]
MPWQSTTALMGTIKVLHQDPSSRPRPGECEVYCSKRYHPQHHQRFFVHFHKPPYQLTTTTRCSTPDVLISICLDLLYP